MENLIKALQIFIKYDNQTFPTNCEHDMLYVTVNPRDVSEDDINELSELGFNAVEDLGVFSSSFFGSN